MATGGFKAFEHVFQGEQYTTSYSYSVVETAIKDLLKALTQKIIATAPHWTYDSNFTATENDFVKIGTVSNYWYQACYAQFLINSVTGSKLLIYYNPGSSVLVNQSMVMKYEASTCVWGFGLCMSMIPGGSSQTWDTSSNCTTANFLPTEATPIIGTGSYPSSTSSSSLGTTFLAFHGANNHRYVFLIKEDVILVFWQDVNTGNLYGCNAIGKLFGALCNSGDTGACSQYGCLMFKADNNTNRSEGESTSSLINSRTGVFINTNSGGYAYVKSMFASYFAVSTAERPSSISGASISASNPRSFSDYYTSASTTNKTAFTPFMMAGSVNVTSGSKFKGYLDTDVFRGVYFGFPYNTLFDNGKFIYVGAGLAVGWDPSNTVILRT